MCDIDVPLLKTFFHIQKYRGRIGIRRGDLCIHFQNVVMHIMKLLTLNSLSFKSLLILFFYFFFPPLPQARKRPAPLAGERLAPLSRGRPTPRRNSPLTSMRSFLLLRLRSPFSLRSHSSWNMMSRIHC